MSTKTTEQFIPMVASMIRAAGRRAAAGDPDHLAQLNELHRAVDQAMADAVAGQRQSGIFWSSIGEALGVTKSAAQMKYGARKAG